MKRTHSFLGLSLTAAATLFALNSVGCGPLDGPDGTTDEDTVIGAIVFNPDLSYGTVADIDGQIYKTIAIGTQTWMAENLNASHYANGDAIINANTNALWNVVGPAYAEYPYTPDWSDFYGKLYNGYAALDPRNICPSGWHVPTNAEWTTLYTYLGGDAVTVGGKMQETGMSHWKETYGTTSNVTNESGFTGLPGGTRGPSNGAEFANQYGAGCWWTSTELHNAEDEIHYWYLTAYSQQAQLNQGVYMSDHNGGSELHGDYKYMGLSVRCVRN